MEFAYDHGVEYPAFFLYKPLAGTDEGMGELVRFVKEAAAEERGSFEKAGDDEFLLFLLPWLAELFVWCVS